VVGFQVAGAPPPSTLEKISAELPEPVRTRWQKPEEALVELAGNINAVECSLL
jgi:Flp pilus assembly protein TadB